MASIDLYPLRAPSPELVPVPFSASLDGANNPTLLEGKRVISSIVHTAAGIYTVTLKDGWVAMMSEGFFLEAATPVDLVPQGKSHAVTKSGGKTVVVRLLTGAVETDPPAAAGNATVLSGVLWLRNTTLAS